MEATQVILDFEQACKLTGYKESYMYKLTSSRQIPFYKRGKRIWFVQQELNAWLLSNPVKTSEQLEREACNYVTGTH